MNKLNLKLKKLKVDNMIKEREVLEKLYKQNIKKNKINI